MQFYPMYEQRNATKVVEFIRSQPASRLITIAHDGRLHFGIFNHFFDGQSFYLHLHRNDEQIQDIKARPRALVAVEDFLAVIPSYWVDQEYAGAATAYYRYVECDCSAEIAESKPVLMEYLQKMMDHYQPEGKYTPLNPDLHMYKRSFDTLAIVRLNPTTTRTKWKVGQNHSPLIRTHIIAHLRERGARNDLRAADAVQEWMSEE